jgi:hypothetical protein
MYLRGCLVTLSFYYNGFIFIKNAMDLFQESNFIIPWLFDKPQGEYKNIDLV